jgi:hypothetical protein
MMETLIWGIAFRKVKRLFQGRVLRLTGLEHRAILNLTVELDAERGGKMHAKHLCHEHLAFLEPMCAVTPGHVEQVIKHALTSGWTPGDANGENHFHLSEFGFVLTCQPY